MNVLESGVKADKFAGGPYESGFTVDLGANTIVVDIDTKYINWTLNFSEKLSLGKETTSN